MRYGVHTDGDSCAAVRIYVNSRPIFRSAVHAYVVLLVEVTKGRIEINRLIGHQACVLGLYIMY